MKDQEEIEDRIQQLMQVEKSCNDQEDWQGAARTHACILNLKWVLEEQNA